MKNQKGITLVELLAVLAIIGIIAVLITSVLINGSNASKRTSMNQSLQQEGNIIVETVRAQYLMNQQDDSIPDKFELLVQNDKLIFSDETGSQIVISEGFTYDLDPAAAPNSLSKKKAIFDRTQKSEFNLIIRGKSNTNASTQEFKVNTSFSKLN